MSYFYMFTFYSSAHESPSSKKSDLAIINDGHRCWQVTSLQKSKEELVQITNVLGYQFAEGYCQYTLNNKTSF